MFTPASFIVFFKDGPFAWNGVFVWWVPVTAFLVWFLPNFTMLLKAVDKDDLASSEQDPTLAAEVAELRRRLDALAR